MRIIVMCQEEPTTMGPCLIRILRARRDDIVAVAIGDLRGAGGKVKTKEGAWRRFLTLWTLFEPLGVLRMLTVLIGWRIIRALGPLGRALDERSVDVAAERLGIPVLRFENPNRPEFLERLRALDPDIIFNQSECLLKKPLLELPRIGVVNRHGSRLPRHRGRLATFYAHADFAGRYDVTVHFVDEAIDSGPIICQRSFPIDPGAPFGQALHRVFTSSPEVVLEAFRRLEDPDFEAMPNDIEEGTLNGFPKVEDAMAYRRRLAAVRTGRA